jgi:NTP pyrophosphatase (non-canonical NTP hydrolase)
MEPMHFEEYQKQAKTTALYESLEKQRILTTLGLAGESGEVAEKMKKFFRDKKGQVDEDFRMNLKKELGDVLWYVAMLAESFDLGLEEIAGHNLQKLASRKDRGVLHGNGDHR